ncbi:hypothetical protein OROMI_010518 [Orobanche minor]
MISKQLLLTYLYLFIYILLSSGVILYNKWVLSPKYFNFPFPITLTMIHMGFSGLVAFFLIRVFKVVSPVKMTFKIYATCVIPISAFFASSLWFGNTAYLFISVAFIQMLKALMPVATFLMAVICGTDKLRCDLFLNMVLVSFGVVISSYGEIHFNVVGTMYQVTGIVAEALRLVLTQVLLQKKGLTLNPITSLYYIAPCSFRVSLYTLVPFGDACNGSISDPYQCLDIFLKCTLCLGFEFLNLPGNWQNGCSDHSGGWCVERLDTYCPLDRYISGVDDHQSKYYRLCHSLLGVVMYNYLKAKDVRSSQTPGEINTERAAKDFLMTEKRSPSPYGVDENSKNGSYVEVMVDEEAPLIPSLKGLSSRTKPS